MKPDLLQTVSLSSGLSQRQGRGKASATLLKKTLNQQADTISTLMQSVSAPALPANPAVGRNINTTA